MKKPFLSACLIILCSVEALANTTISSSSSSSTSFSSNNEIITIAAGGNIAKTASPSAIISSGLTGIQLIVNANSGEGISHTDNASAAVEINGGSFQNIEVNSGRITSNARETLGTISLNSQTGTGVISVANGAEITNSNADLGSAILYSGAVSGATLNIDNAGNISTADGATNTAIDIRGNAGSVNINNSNLIDSSLGKAISLEVDGGGSINNSGNGQINGGISILRGTFSITNSLAATINGSIFLGTHADSSINNYGIINSGLGGGLAFVNAGQRLILHSGASFSGYVDGAGIVTLANLSLLSLDTNTVLATINGTSSSNKGNVSINADQTVITNANIGQTVGLGLLTMLSNSTLDLATNNNSARFEIVSMHNGSTINLGTGTLHGNISSNTSEHLGTVNLTDNYTLGGSIGAGSFRLHAINITGSKTINAGANDMGATTISMGVDSTLNSAARLDGAVLMGTGATLNLSSGAIVNATINGNSGTKGLITASGEVIFGDNVGTSNAINQITVNSGADARFRGDISASTISFAGDLYLDKIGGNDVSGNMTGSGSAMLNLGSGNNTLNGNLTLVSGNSLGVTITGATSVGNIIVSGIASLDANTVLRITTSFTPTIGTSYTIVNGGTGSTINKIADANIRINNVATAIFGNVRFETSVSGDDLLLNVYELTAPTSNIAQNSNESNAHAAILNATSASGNLAALQTYLDNSAVSNSAKSQALNSATPQVDNSANRVSFNSANNSLNLTSQRLHSLKGVASGDGTNSRSAWAQVFGTSVHQGNSSGINGYKAGSFGFAGGFDHEISNDVIGGISFSYANSDIKSNDDLKKTRVNSYQVNLYAGKDFEKFFLHGMVGYALSKYDSNRAIPVVGAAARADYNGQTYVARAELGKNISLKNEMIFTPTLALTAAKNNIDNYNESGAGTLNLNVVNHSTDFFEARAGAKLGKNFTLKNGKKIHPIIFTSYGYDFAANRQHSSARFVGQSASFDSSAANIAQGSLIIGTGVKFFQSDFFSLNLDYAFEQRSQYSAHYGSLKGKYEF